MQNNNYERSRIGWLRLFLLAAVVFCTFFANNGVLVPDIMESRNLVTGREMVETGEYMVPAMNGEIRLAKPPLPTWIAASIESVSADDIAMQRCAAGCAGILLTLFLYLYAGRILRIDPLWPTLLLLTCYNVVLMGRTVSWDIYCHAFMMGGIYFLAKALQGSGRQTAAFAWSGLFTGLSILSKGPVSLYALFLPWLIATICCRREKMKGKWGGVLLMIIVAIVCGCWWYAFIYFYHKQELQAVAAQESGAWMHRNVRPFWYYHKFYLETGVWALLLITAIIRVFIYRGHRVRGWLTPFVWMVAGLVLLSLLPEKKNRYLLPVLIPAALLMGQMVNDWITLFRTKSRVTKFDKYAFRINDFILTLIIALLPGAAWWFCYGETAGLSFLVLMLITVICGGVAIGMIWSLIRLKPAVMVWGVTIVFMTLEIFGLPAVKPLINNSAMHSVRLLADRKELQAIPFYTNKADELRIEMVYAARRNITPVSFTDSALIKISLPALILTHNGARELPPKYLQGVDTVYLGRFDDNRRPKGNRRYDSMFIYHATLLRPKK